MVLIMKASYAELKEEIHEMKRRISALEKAYDAIATRDDLLAIEEAHEDLKEGKTVSLARAKDFR
jgi:predicted  nucleic acid-binding Zn-ribbon protein